MANKALRLGVGAIYQKRAGGFYYFRYQLNGHRKTVGLGTQKKDEAIKAAEKLFPVIKATSTEVIAAHVKEARGFSTAKRNLALSGAWDFYSCHPDRANPATSFEQEMYHASLDEFIKFLNNPSACVRDVTPETIDRFVKYLKTTHISVETHNRKIKRIRKIFSTLKEFYDGENPFSSEVFFRKNREEQDLSVRRLAFTREQEQKILDVLSDSRYKVVNKSEVQIIYHIGMFTGQRLKGCVLLKWSNIDLERRKIWVKQFKTGKEVTIPIAGALLDALKTALSWQCNEYVCPKSAERYKKTDKTGKNVGNNLVGIDVLRIIRWTGLETSVPVPGRKRKMTQYGFHSLRHSFASHCAEAGVPKAVLLSILGTNSDIADKYYTHIGEEAQIKAIQSVYGEAGMSAQERISKAIEYLKGLPDSPDRNILLEILSSKGCHHPQLLPSPVNLQTV